MPIVDNIIGSCARIMNDSLNKLEKSNDFASRLQYCNALFENAVRLQEYEKRGISTIKPKPSIFIEECEKIKKDLYHQSISQDKVC
ncbi:MAG: hypothetical protein K9H14_07945 [Actinomycetia bacterium]|nr:hypothetical protein [Actinomycetes bacterium]